MGCLSHRKKQTENFVDQKWDHINLADFKTKGCGPPFAYGFLWFSLILSVAVYGVDSFTAVQLLVFNRWSSKIEPAIPFYISKWIFSVCILLSFVNLIYEGIRAARIIKRGNVADCYLDSLAVRWQSIRLGSGQGYKRFLVFTELTRGKKGAEYVALFTYFQFQAWIRVIFCMGPRQVVNALTLRSVYLAKLAPTSATFEGSISGFFNNIKTLAEEDYRQALILSGMCFTLVIWIFSALYIITATLFYLFFLFHWIPRADGGLTGYCERKVNKALLKIVTKTVNQALAKGQTERMKAAMSGEKVDIHPDTTLPTLPNVDLVQEKGIVPPPPAYSSHPRTPGNGVNTMDWKRPVASRTGTVTSNLTSSTYSSRAPLVSSAAEMGRGRSESPEFMCRGIDSNMPPPQRRDTTNSQRSYGPRPDMDRLRNESSSSLPRPMMQSSVPMNPEAGPPYAPRGGPPMSRTIDDYNRQMPTSWDHGTYNPDAQSSIAPSVRSFGAPRQLTRSSTNQAPFRGPQYPPQRSMTAQTQPIGNYYERSGIQQSRQPPRQNFYGYRGASQGQPGAAYGYDMEAQRNGRY